MDHVGKDAEVTQDFEIITAPGSDLQMLQRSSPSAGWAGLVDHFRSGRLDGTAIAQHGSYSMVAPIYACVKARADALAMMPMRVGNSEDEIIESGPLAELAMQPAPGLSARQFWRTTESHLLLFGRCHWKLETLPGGQVTAVHPLNPRAMTHRIDASNGELLGWIFAPPGTGRQELLMPSQVHSIIDPDFERPECPWEGLSPRKAAALAIAQYHAADQANQASLANGVSVGSVFSVDSGHQLTEEQWKRIKAQLKEQYGGVTKRHSPLVAEGGISVQQVGATFTDMEFAQLKSMSRTDICAAFSVPPPVCGFFEDSNYAHADAAEKAFWLRTVLPRAAWLAEEFQQAVVRRFVGDRSLGFTSATRRAMKPRDIFGRNFARAAMPITRAGLFCWFDSSSIPAVQAAQASLADAATKWAALGVPLADFLDSHDVGYARRPWMETWWKSPLLMDVNDDSTGFVGDPDGAGDGDMLDDATPAPEPASQGMKAITRDLSERQKAALWQAHRQSYAALEGSFKSKISGHFNALRKETLGNLERLAPQLKSMDDAATKRVVLGEILFSIINADNALAVRVGPLIREASRLGGSQAMQEAADATGKLDANPFQIENPYMLEQIRQRRQNIARVNHTLRRRISQSIYQGASQNETTTQLAARIRKEFNFAVGRARTIAMTEVGAAVEEGRQEGRKQAGTPMKSWLWSRKETGRHWHYQTEQETSETPIANNAKFTIATTGNEAIGPRLSGDAKDDVNCGCSTLARYPGDSMKAVLERYTAKGFLTYEQLQARDAQASQTQDVKSS